ncbi:MAG: hypothetical protein HXL15_01820 [Parvimonas sp.]|jgi:hypothetical protein|nr:hypothetical protein [Parvimonas sp.]
MANNIQAAKKYLPVLDEIYKVNSLTAVLDGNPELAREGANAGELLIAKLSMQGLADYNRNTGYVDGDVTLEWETIKADYDRGRMFSVDNVDNQDSADVAFGQLANEFIRTKVTPELDATRFAKYAQTSGVGKASGALDDGAKVIAAIRKAVTTMDEAEVPAEGRILFITPTLKGLVDDLDTNKSREVLKKFAEIKEVPQSRFYTQITLTPNAAGGYTKTATTGKEINFMIVHPTATVQFPKHIAPKVVTPEQNQNADAYKFGYRIVGIAKVKENKVSGIYVHEGTK